MIWFYKLKWLTGARCVKLVVRGPKTGARLWFTTFPPGVSVSLLLPPPLGWSHQKNTAPGGGGRELQIQTSRPAAVRSWAGMISDFFFVFKSPVRKNSINYYKRFNKFKFTSVFSSCCFHWMFNAFDLQLFDSVLSDPHTSRSSTCLLRRVSECGTEKQWEQEEVSVSQPVPGDGAAACKGWKWNSNPIIGRCCKPFISPSTLLRADICSAAFCS